MCRVGISLACPWAPLDHGSHGYPLDVGIWQKRFLHWSRWGTRIFLCGYSRRLQCTSTDSRCLHKAADECWFFQGGSVCHSGGPWREERSSPYAAVAATSCCCSSRLVPVRGRHQITTRGASAVPCQQQLTRPAGQKQADLFPTMRTALSDKKTHSMAPLFVVLQAWAEDCVGDEARYMSGDP